MFRQPDFLPAADPLAGILPNAEPAHLIALAGYFEVQARRLRVEAHCLQNKLDSAAQARRYRAEDRRENMRLGALCAVLTRRYGGERSAAISEVQNRTGHSREAIAHAVASWIKEKARRAKLKRNLQIFSADAAGERQVDIAKRFKITPRRVHEIVSEVRARLHSVNRPSKWQSPFQLTAR